MDFKFTKSAFSEFSYWIENDHRKVKKINALLKSIKKTPFKGLGIPEPLKNNLQGFWSRRIDHEHRLVYRIDGKKGESYCCSIVQCKYHY